MRNGSQAVGRYDSRYSAYSIDTISDQPDFDATDSAINSAFVGAGNYFVRQILGYNTDQEYRVELGEINRSWDWKRDGNLPTNTAQDLARAMVYNPNMRVFSANGYYDLATPFFATVYTLNHLNVPPAGFRPRLPTGSTSRATWYTSIRRPWRSFTTIWNAGTTPSSPDASVDVISPRRAEASRSRARPLGVAAGARRFRSSLRDLLA